MSAGATVHCRLGQRHSSVVAPTEVDDNALSEGMGSACQLAQVAAAAEFLGSCTCTISQFPQQTQMPDVQHWQCPSSAQAAHLAVWRCRRVLLQRSSEVAVVLAAQHHVAQRVHVAGIKACSRWQKKGKIAGCQILPKPGEQLLSQHLPLLVGCRLTNTGGLTQSWSVDLLPVRAGLRFTQGEGIQTMTLAGSMQSQYESPTCRHQHQLRAKHVQCRRHHPVKHCPVGAPATARRQRHVESGANARALPNLRHITCSSTQSRQRHAEQSLSHAL